MNNTEENIQLMRVLENLGMNDIVARHGDKLVVIRHSLPAQLETNIIDFSQISMEDLLAAVLGNEEL